VGTVTARGRVARVNGPLVQVEGMAGTAMLDAVELGAQRLPGEVVAIRGDLVTVQAYEYTGGLAAGAVATSRGEPLSAPLGPHLLGGLFDGLLRPLAGAGTWLTPARRDQGNGRVWEFTPSVTEGALVAPGAPLGTVGGAGAVPYLVLVPPGVGGRVQAIRPTGAYPANAPLATVAGHDVAMTLRWPVRRPKPLRERLDAVVPLLTGQRVIDMLLPVPQGGTAAVPGGFGTGKTVLLQQIAKWCDADVIVYAGCGERGNELADVVAELAELADPRTGGRLLQRTWSSPTPPTCR
jgi:V/A-type H+/Na+-transporting ATPase subunit A